MEGADRAATTTWLRKHRLVYSGAACDHPFILSIHDGSVNLSSFKQWLGQDYVYFKSGVPFMASVMVKAWKESDNKSDVDVLLGGLAAMNKEIAWFEKEAPNWSVDLSSVVPQQATINYCRYFESLMSSDVDYTQAITALWALEIVYQGSFAHCVKDDNKLPDELKEICQHWGGSDDYVKYCDTLKSIVNRRLDKVSSDDVVAKAEATFLRVLELQVEFCNMGCAAVL